MNKKFKREKIAIIGAGPAGLAAAYEIAKQDQDKHFEISIFEADSQVGGLAKTLRFKGFRFDLGGHRFYTKFPEIDLFYKSFLDKEMLKRERLSRIYYQGRFYNYPLSSINAVKNLGLRKASVIFLSYLFRQFNKYKNEKTFDEWVSNRFGDKLFKIFFKSYTEKVWGIPTWKLSSDWAAQRIQDFNLLKAIFEAIFNKHSGSKTTITKFYYPKFGPGMLYERMQKMLENNGVKIYLNSEVTGLNLNNSQKIDQVKVRTGNTRSLWFNADHVISTMPLNQLALLLKPSDRLVQKIGKLKFRNFITVNLLIKSNPFPDQWIYIHEPQVKVGRIQNFRNWSPYMVKKNSIITPIGMEYFCEEGDKLWLSEDRKLLELAADEIVSIGLVKKKDILDGFVYRVKNAYPVYNFDYETPFREVKKNVSQFNNLHLCGRGGLFRYNNQDHSILSGFYVARNIVSKDKKNDVWKINEEGDYLERKNTADAKNDL